ncbi:WD40 repeat stress protein/actin interacting protein [Phaffia rhodozyma]|uniref:WD40 repeat stress protein/actin interacting protein n=1 Tax=Phaffia rhodozyma TaxID=264483 RepID=A0A0F7SWD4_PHARH|nr:WD40 repeat stress protein/actin interacting protein [Phaffia rhodozyma]
MSYNKAGVYPPNPVTTRGRACKISSDGKGEKLVYVNEKAVVIRDIRNLAQSITYTQHLTPPTIARLSPSGYYCASADASGTVRVWDVAGSDQILKLESKSLLGGRANDLAWDSESKRLVVVGEGRESFGKAILVDGGTSCGEISGHSKAINAVTLRPKRPFRAVTCGDDGNIVLLNGVPYKFSKIIKSHSSFINDVQYAPSGDVFASVGADGKVFLYEGAEGDIKGELSAGASSSSLYGLAFSPDSASLATSSASSIIQLYDPSTLSATTSFNLSFSSSSDPSSQQLGLTYLTPQTLASVSLSGALHILDTREPDRRTSLLGPTRGITATGFVTGETEGTFWAGGFDGGVKRLEENTWKDVVGVGHGGQLVGFANGVDGVWSAGWDDSVREVKQGEYSSNTLPTGAQPTSIASLSAKDLVAVSTGQAVDVLVSGKKVASRSFEGERVLSVDLADGLLAVGTEANKVYVFEFSKEAPEKLSSANPTTTFTDNRNPVYVVSFNPEGTLLAAGESGGKIQVYDITGRKIKISGRWGSHTGRITSLRWTTDGKHCASSSLDTNVFVWSVERPLRSIKIPNAHAGGATGVEWVNPSRLASAGSDATVRFWDIVFH